MQYRYDFNQKLLKLILMGVVTSVCCDRDPSEISKHAPFPLPLSPQTRKNLKSPNLTGKTNGNSQPDRSNGDSPQRKDSRQSHQQHVIKHLQEKFPLPNDKKSLKWSDFKVTHRIGSGGFGQVFLGELIGIKTKGKIEKYAIKRIPKYQVLGKKLTTNIKLEKKILQESHCLFITTLHYAFRDAKFLYLVMEWARGGDVFTFIYEKSPRLERFKSLGEKAVRFLLGCIVLGLEYLHSKGIVYRDLKPQNVLVFDDGYAKLTDFGLAKQLHDDELTKTVAGTTFYYAPQIVLRQGYGKEVDLWTLGIFAYEISNYSPPFTGPQIKDRLKVKRIVRIAENNRKWENPSTSQQLKDLINGLLRFDSTQRLGYQSWDEVKSHKFFKSKQFSWKVLAQGNMKSPLKAVIDSYRERYKPYNPEDTSKVPEVTSSAQEQFNTWSKNSNHHRP